MALTDTAIARAKPSDKPRRFFDGDGLYLLLNPNGTRWWRLDYRHVGKRKTLSLGVYPLVTLLAARALANEARKLLADGVDPSEDRRARKERIRTAENEKRLFGAVLKEWRDDRTHTIAASTQVKQDGMVARYLTPTIGHQSIGDLNARSILRVLQPIDRAGRHETAQELKRIIGQVLRYGVASGLCERDWTQDLRGALPKATATSHAGVTEPKALGALLRTIHTPSYGSPVVTFALQLAPLVFTRPVELRTMEWAHVDFAKSLWRVPAHVMKKRRPHLVPLSKQAVKILRMIQPLTGQGRYVFPGFRSAHKPMSEAALNRALIRIGYGPDVHTPHGFRTTASTRLHEMGFESDHVEMQLAHLVPGAKGVYNQAQYLPQRIRMMQKWADYLDTLRAAR